MAAAAFVAKTNLESIGLVDSLCYWTFTDVFEENRSGDAVFHGGFGLINYQEIVKPAFHAYRIMNELGDELLKQETGGVVSRDKESGRVTVVAYNYPPEMKVSLPVTNTLAAADAIDASGSARELTLDMDHLPAGASFEVEILDRKHGDAVTAWEAMGRPEPPTREQTAELRRLAWDTKKDVLHADKDGQLHFRLSMPAWGLVLVKQM